MTASELNTTSVAALIVAAVSPQSVYLQQPVDTHAHKLPNMLFLFPVGLHCIVIIKEQV